MTDKPLVSVLMTSYNREKYIGEAIESVINSSYKNFELIIVDDCSKDKTVEIAQSYAAKDKRIQVYINEQNLGDYPNRNKAASYATGKYIKYLDSDDIIYLHGLEVMVTCMEKFPDAGFGLSSVGDAKSPYPVMLTSYEIYYEHFNGFGHFDRAPGSAIINLIAFRKVCGFSGKRMIGDNELWLKLARNYPMVKFMRDLVWDRIHSGQESKTEYAKLYERLKYEIYFDALTHQDCPLNKEYSESLIKNLKVNEVKNIINRLRGK